MVCYKYRTNLNTKKLHTLPLKQPWEAKGYMKFLFLRMNHEALFLQNI